MKQLYGVDGCPGGWVVVQSDTDLHNISFSIVQDLASLFHLAQGGVVAIDIPVGLPVPGPRVCDQQARKLLGQPRGSSVFPAPARAALKAKTHGEAKEINQKALGVGISIQAFSIIPKIREVDEVMSPERQRYIREVHPEVSFAGLNAGKPMQENKRTAPGRAERIGVLKMHHLKISETSLGDEQRKLGTTKVVAMDDVIDALVCLITALHIHNDKAHAIGDPKQRDSRGLLMEIVSPNPQDNLVQRLAAGA